jgi:hypothetical protein
MLVQVAKYTQAWLNILGVGGPSRDEIVQLYECNQQVSQL